MIKKLYKLITWFLGKSYTPDKNPQTCQCTNYDFQCDYGFIRQDNGECIEDPNFGNREKDICIDEKEEEIISKGYKLIPGDKCNMDRLPDSDKREF